MFAESLSTPVAAGEQPPTPVHTVWFINEFSTHAELNMGKCQEMYESQGESAVWIPTTIDGTDQERLEREVRDHEEVEIVVGGGDGTLQAAIKTLFSGLTPRELAIKTKNITISVLGTGNKNDVANMLHGAAYSNLSEILGSTTRTVRPLLIQKRILKPPASKTVDDSQEWAWESVHTAVYSFGMGATAAGAEFANSPDYRGVNGKHPETTIDKLRYKIAQRIADLRLAWNSLYARTATKEHGVVTDVTAANGSKMGGDMKFPVRLDEPGFFVSITKPGRLSQVNSLSDRLLGVGHSGLFVHGSYNFEITEETVAHVDGEIIMLEPGLYKIAESPIALRFRSVLSGKHQQMALQPKR